MTPRRGEKVYTSVTFGKCPEGEAEPRGNASQPVSLAPLSFAEALDGPPAVEPEPKGEPKETKKRAVKKPVSK